MNENILAIDLGLDNLATCTTNGIIKPFVINGKPLKALIEKLKEGIADWLHPAFINI
ncbi:MAG: hypothetical protein HQK76_21125 [Desulfobacterales bacterium]|nr:hypothetical protein [Desulfobacterales bacterium]